jgi:FixJ family two-component response regulator
MSTYQTTTRYRGHTIDLIAIGRHLADSRPLPELTEVEKEFAAQVLTQAGLGAHEIAARLGVAQRTVTRWRARWAEAAC